ncbi:MAG: hypothetical protein FWE16_02195 [Firmicutes bacterium]|nr:hypothetical protein [Bacillota bacterium]
MKLIPKLKPGKFEFITTQVPTIPPEAVVIIKEDEGITLVMPTDKTCGDIFAMI